MKKLTRLALAVLFVALFTVLGFGVALLQSWASSLFGGPAVFAGLVLAILVWRAYVLIGEHQNAES